MSTNQQRSEWAKRSLALAALLVGTEKPADTVTALIACIGHHCQANNAPFLELVAQGIARWHEEQQDETRFFSTPPAVTITVNGSSTHA